MLGAAASPLRLRPAIFPPTLKSKPFPSQTPLRFLRPNSLIFSTPITRTNASNKQRETNSTTVGTDDDEDDEEEDFLAFEEMRKWELNKPSGFGEGKMYDTTVEEKLLEEMEKERLSQLDADKNKVDGSSSKRQEQPQKDFIPSGPSVRLGNLPKKKNIHRDLQIAFKGFAGIVKISPAVTGNQKTRDPICKGFAFVELESEETAIRFVKTFSKPNILFGKVQKQISCDIVNPVKLANGIMTSTQPNFMNSEDETFHEGFIDMTTVDPNEEFTLVRNDTSDLLSDSKELEMGIDHLNVSPISDAENGSHVSGKGTGSDNSKPSFEKQRKQMASRKKLVKRKSAKATKLSLPSSMTRLKIKERTVLTGVFSKYGGKIASASD